MKIKLGLVNATRKSVKALAQHHGGKLLHWWQDTPGGCPVATLEFLERDDAQAFLDEAYDGTADELDAYIIE